MIGGGEGDARRGRDHRPGADARVLAKAVGELIYEGVLTPAAIGERDPAGEHRIDLASGARYRFQAWRSIWGSLDVEPGSVTRADDAEGRPADCAGFLIDARWELGLSDITAGHLLEEVQNTVFAEAEQRRRLEATDAGAMAGMSGVALEALLDAHPKMIGNRGRIGWGSSDLAEYAPEFMPRFRLRWIAVRRGRARAVLAPGVSTSSLLRAGMSDEELATLRGRAAERGVDLERDALLPVHPWQWLRYIRVQYAALIGAGEVVDLGVLGDRFMPQQSIRTLSNVDRPGLYDVKLSLSILNTSCYRGIPARFVETGGALSAWIAEIASRDPVLAERGAVVLRDMAGIHCPHPAYARVPGAPYRYHEMLGAVWRESAAGKVGSGAQVIPTAALFQCDPQGRPLLAEYVRRSGLSLERWLLVFFDRITVPLYHLLCRHGVGVVAHGQNIGLILDAGRPHGMVLKDFHGDVRLVNQDFEELEGLPRAAREAITRLPSGHLVHDLFTGHFVSVLRFVSAVAERRMGLPERAFYALLARALRRYERENPELSARFSDFGIFRPRMERICLNRARFRLGYADSGEHRLPDLGEPLVNPLASSDHAGDDA